MYDAILPYLKPKYPDISGTKTIPVIELPHAKTQNAIAEKYNLNYSVWGLFTAIDKTCAFRAYYDGFDKEMEEKYGEGYSSETYIFPSGTVPEDIKVLLK